MMTLFQLENCPDCQRVRKVLCDQQATYRAVCVPAVRDSRYDLMRATQQASVPALVDGEQVICGPDAIVAHLERQRRALGAQASLD